MQLRAEEEVARATRHDRPLCLVLLQCPARKEGRLQSWLHDHLRATDLACRRYDDRYLLLLPETNDVGASGLLKRLLGESLVDSFSIVDFNASLEQFRGFIRSLDAPWGRMP